MAYVRTRLGRLFYDERGAARRPNDPAIVLLHGLLFDGGMWRGQIEALSSLGRVLVFDGPGHGKSEPAPRFMIEDHAHAMFDALNELGIEKAVCVGLSWGGMLGMRLAIQHPEKVAGLAVLDASASVEPLINRVKYRAFIAMHRRVGIPYSMWDREIAPLLFSQRTLMERPELVRQSYQRAMGFDRGGASRAAIAVVVHRIDITNQLGRIKTPTLVMVGSEDRSTTPAESEKIAKGIPGAELVILDGLGHMSALEDPEAVNARLIPFVGNCLPD